MASRSLSPAPDPLVEGSLFLILYHPGDVWWVILTPSQHAESHCVGYYTR